MRDYPKDAAGAKTGCRNADGTPNERRTEPLRRGGVTSRDETTATEWSVGRSAAGKRNDQGLRSRRFTRVNIADNPRSRRGLTSSASPNSE